MRIPKQLGRREYIGGETASARALTQYRNSGERLTPVGDEHGLLLIFDRDRQWRMSDDTTRPTAAYPTEVTIRGKAKLEYHVEGYPYRIVVA